MGDKHYFLPFEKLHLYISKHFPYTKDTIEWLGYLNIEEENLHQL